MKSHLKLSTFPLLHLFLTLILNKNSSELIATLQIGINLSLVIYGIIMAQFLEPILIKSLPLSSLANGFEYLVGFLNKTFSEVVIKDFDFFS